MRSFLKLIFLSFAAYIGFCTVTQSAELFHKIRKKSDDDKTYLSADSIFYDKNTEIVEAKGNATIFKDEYILRSNSIFYNQVTGESTLLGKVNITDDKGNVIVSNEAFLNKGVSKGYLKEFSAVLNKNLIITGDKGTLIAKDLYHVKNIKYTPCPICVGRNPLWQINAESTDIDLSQNKIMYHNAIFKIKKVPVFFLPYFSHSTPNATARSGLLVPSIYRDGVKIPFYWRIAPNKDLTLAPILRKNSFIQEAEYRHLLNYGDYIVKLSYKPKQKNVARQYNIFSNGTFKYDDINLLVKVDKSSDESYLKNYYGIHKPYLLSKVSLNSLSKKGFLALDNVSIQNIKAPIYDYKAYNSPAIVPIASLRHRKAVFDLENTFLDINDQGFLYPALQNKNLLYNELAVKLHKTFIYNNGNVFNIGGYNRLELYNYYINDQYSNITTNTPSDFRINSIPEIHTEWRYPLTSSSKNFNSYIVPKVLFIASLHKKKQSDVDQLAYEQNYVDQYINYSNLFSNNRKIGIINYETGNRLAWGCETLITSKNGPQTINFFLGSLKNFDYTHQYKYFPFLGDVNIVFNENLNINYEFYKLIRESYKIVDVNNIIDVNFSAKKLKISLNLVKLNKIADTQYNKNQKQISSTIKYDFSKRWAVGSDIKLGKSAVNKYAALIDNFKVYYSGECASFIINVANDHTSDFKRNIMKQKNKISFSLKLATIY